MAGRIVGMPSAHTVTFRKLRWPSALSTASQPVMAWLTAAASRTSPRTGCSRSWLGSRAGSRASATTSWPPSSACPSTWRPTWPVRRTPRVASVTREREPLIEALLKQILTPMQGS